MLAHRVIAWVLSVGVIAPASGTVWGQSYPSRPIRIITVEAGAGADYVARLIAQGISIPLGQSVVVVNQGLVAVQVVQNSPPDGHTLLTYGGTFWLGPLMRATSYEPLRDFVPIVGTTISPTVIAVHPSLPVKSVKDLIVLARARPGVLNFGSGSVGSAGHLAGELFKSMAGVDIVAINYKGNGPSLNAALVGEVEVIFANAAVIMPHAKSGRLRALATASDRPSALAPGLTTVAATVPGYESASLSGMFAPAKTPESIIRRLNQEIVRVLNAPDTKDRLFAQGLETVGSSPEGFEAKIKSEIVRMGRVINDLGIGIRR